MSIKVNISDSSIGTKRQVRFDGICSMSHEENKANIVWIVDQIDIDGNLLDSVDIDQSRRVITPISDVNRVDDNGVLILRENYPDDESYQAALAAGHPEYTFWWDMLATNTLPDVLTQAATILNSYNRFDRL